MRLIRRMIRWVLRTTLLICGPIVIAIAGLYIYMTTGRYVTTENAYVKADLIIVAAEVSGTVVEVGVADNQMVEKGHLLFRLDARRFEVERDQRAAELGAARQRVEALRARHRAKLAELADAESDVEFLRDELDRSERLRANGTISQTRLIEVRREVAKALTGIGVIREEIAEGLAALGGDAAMRTANHPDVMRARAELDRAGLDLEAATVRAPAAAIAANVRIQQGEYVIEGRPVLSLVADSGFWIEANLKETDLTNLRTGQEATLTVDAFPGREWQAIVSSMAPATGAEYALLPPQNASGNWVKVVQRVPVRLDIVDQADAPQLRAGMSVAVSIDTRHKRELPEVLTNARAWIEPEEAR